MGNLRECSPRPFLDVFEIVPETDGKIMGMFTETLPIIFFK